MHEHIYSNKGISCSYVIKTEITSTRGGEVSVEELLFAKLRPPRAPAPRALTSVTVSSVVCDVCGRRCGRARASALGLGVSIFFSRYGSTVRSMEWRQMCEHMCPLGLAGVSCLVSRSVSLAPAGLPPTPAPRCVSRPRDTRRVRTNDLSRARR